MRVPRSTVAIKYYSNYHVKSYSQNLVLSSLLDMARQKRPEGPAWPVDPDEKVKILARMAERGVNKSQLAAGVGCKPSGITVFFKAKTKTSRLLPKIHKFLDMHDTTMPLAGVNKDEAWRRLVKAWRDMTQAQRDLIVATSEQLAIKP